MRAVWSSDLDALRWTQRLPYALGLLWRVDAFRAALTSGGRPPALGSTQAGLVLAGVAACAVTIGVVGSLLPTEQRLVRGGVDDVHDAVRAAIESVRDPIAMDPTAPTARDAAGVVEPSLTPSSAVVPMPWGPTVESPDGIDASAARHGLPELLLRFDPARAGGAEVDTELGSLVDQLHAMAASLGSRPYVIGVEGRVGIWLDLSDDPEALVAPTEIDFGYALPVVGGDDGGGQRLEPR